MSTEIDTSNSPSGLTCGCLVLVLMLGLAFGLLLYPLIPGLNEPIRSLLHSIGQWLVEST